MHKNCVETRDKHIYMQIGDISPRKSIFSTYAYCNISALWEDCFHSNVYEADQVHLHLQ